MAPKLGTHTRKGKVTGQRTHNKEFGRSSAPPLRFLRVPAAGQHRPAPCSLRSSLRCVRILLVLVRCPVCLWCPALCVGAFARAFRLFPFLVARFVPSSSPWPSSRLGLAARFAIRRLGWSWCPACGEAFAAGASVFVVCGGCLSAACACSSSSSCCGALLLLASLVPGLSWLRLPAALRSRLRLRRLCGVACLALRCSSGALRVLMRLCGRLSLAVGSSLWLALAVVSLLPVCLVCQCSGCLPRSGAARCSRGALAQRVWFRRLGQGPASVAWVPALGPARRLRRGLGWPSGSCFPLGSFPGLLGSWSLVGVGGCWVLARFGGSLFLAALF